MPHATIIPMKKKDQDLDPKIKNYFRKLAERSHEVQKEKHGDHLSEIMRRRRLGLKDSSFKAKVSEE
jgi:hypothetical protein